MRLILFFILTILAFVSYGQCDDCPPVIEAPTSDIATSEFPYYDGSKLNCIDYLSGGLNAVLQNIDDKLCFIADTIEYYSLVNDSTSDNLDSLITLINAAIVNSAKIPQYIVTSNNSSVNVVLVNDTTYDLSLNTSMLDSAITGVVETCYYDSVLTTFADAINYLSCDILSTSGMDYVEPYFVAETSTNGSAIRAIITPYVTNPLTTDDCQEIYYYYNVYDTLGVVIPNGSGIWHGGNAYGVSKEFEIEADVSSQKTLVIEMKVTRISCSTYRTRKTEIHPPISYVINEITPNCGWETSSGVWNTLSGKWCSE